MKDPKVIRVDDRVRIIHPYFVERVGYPLDKEKVKDIIIGKCLPQVVESVLLFEKLLGCRLDKKGRVEEKLVNALVYSYIGGSKFGGNERKIYCSYDRFFKDAEVTVDSIRFVKTGTYQAGSYYYEQEDYEPAYLAEETTHKLLNVSIMSWRLDSTEIPACFVEKS